MTASRSRFTLAIAAGLVGLACQAASATVYMDENFESYTNGATLPTTTLTAPGWQTVSVNLSPETGNAVDTITAAQTQVSGTSGNQGLRLYDNGVNNTSPNVRYNWATTGSGIVTGASATVPTLYFQFDFNMGEDDAAFNAVVRIHGASSSANVAAGLVIDRNDNGDIYVINNGGTAGQIGFDLAGNTWFRAAMVLDMVAKTYSVQLYDSSLNAISGASATGLTFQAAATEILGFIASDNNASGTSSDGFGPAGKSFYIDNIYVGSEPPAVPEPASLGLLGLGALAMLRRRRAA